MLYVVELGASRVLVGSRNDDVSIISDDTYVIIPDSSAYLQSSFPGVTALGSEALTTHDTGPMAEPGIMLAVTLQPNI